MPTLNTKYYGEIEYNEKDLVHFPDGLFGFQDLHDFLLMSLNEEDENIMLLLQSVENIHVAFVVLDPFRLDADYDPHLTPEELTYLRADSEDDLSFYVICVLHKNYLEDTVNMKSPLVMNPATRIGMQVILSDSSYPYRKTLGSFPSVAGKSEE